jgi:hypothetical protein
MAALSRDSKPQEKESEKDEQGFKDDIHFCVRDVMKTKDPMDPHDVNAQHETHASEHAPEK